MIEDQLNSTVRLRVEAASVCLECDNPQPLLDEIHGRFHSHLSSVPEFVHSADLVVHATLTDEQQDADEDIVCVALIVHGRLNGSEVRFESRAEKNVPTYETERRCKRESQRTAVVASSGLLGWLLYEMVGLAWRGRRGRQPKTKHLIRMIGDTTVEIRQQLDELVNRPPLSSLPQWRLTNVIGILMGLLLIPIWGYLYTVLHPDRTFGDGWGVGLINGGMAVVPTYGLVVSIGLLFLPPHFFETEVAGHRVMNFAGANSVAGVRYVAVFCIMLCLIMLAGLVYMTVALFR